MRNMSFLKTIEQFMDGSKDVTRRLGWKFAKVDDIVQGVEKGQGLKNGEKIKKMGMIMFRDLRWEPLNRLILEPEYGELEVIREGFPDMTPGEFVEMFREMNKCAADALVHRMVFSHIRIARTSFADDYICRYQWPPNCFVQAGGNGIVLAKPKVYETAFFEAFPKVPKTFIRGEAETIEYAEKAAWERYLHFKKCAGHEYEKRAYTNGAGFCIHCGMFKSKAFEPWESCFNCGNKTYHSKDKHGEWWCEECQVPEDRKTSAQIYVDDYLARKAAKEKQQEIQWPEDDPWS